MGDCLGDETIAAYVDGLLDLGEVSNVDHHIDDCSTCRAQLSAMAGSPILHSFVGEPSLAAGSLASAALTRAGGPAPGDALGRYIVEAVIGRGGMGVVVRAHDPELDRAVAIKLVDPLIWDSEQPSTSGPGRRATGAWRSRLRTEARAMARLRHPNVVAVHDVGSVGEQLFIAMELVDGHSLTRWLVQHRASGPVAALATCVAAGRGLCAAHAAGLVHGDVKPDNILVDRDGRAMIGDFGLASVIGNHDLAPEGTSRLCGTPAFMAPELFRGAPADARSDQFAFAVTVYQAVAGERPWRGDTIDELQSALDRGLPPRPPTIPVSLWMPLARALAADPAARHPSLGAFLDAIERAAARTRRRFRLAIGGGTAAVLGAGVIAITLGVRGEAEPCPDPVARISTVLPTVLCGATPSPPCSALAAALDRRLTTWRTTHVAVCRATREGRQSAELLDRRMRCLDQRLVEHGVFVEQVGGAPLDPKAAFGALGALARLEAPVACETSDQPGRYAAPPAERAAAIGEAERWVATANADYALGRYRLGLDAVAPHFDAIRALAHPPLIAAAAKILGQLQRRAGQLAAAEASFDVGLRAAAEASDDHTTAALLLDRAYLVGEARQDLARGAELLRAAEVAIVRAGNPPKLESDYLITRAGFAEQRGDYPAATADLTRAVELRRRSAGHDAPDTAIALQRLCGVESQIGKLAEARRHCEEAVDLLGRALGAQHPMVAEAISSLAVAIAIEGDLKLARTTWEKALAVVERSLGVQDPEQVPMLLNLGDVSRMLGDPAAAERYLARAVELSGKDANDANDIELRLRVASQLGSTGRAAEALAMREDLVRRAEAQLGRDHPSTASALADLARSYYNADRLPDARALFERAIAAHSAINGERHAVTLTLQGQYGQTLMALKDAAAARKVYEHVMLALESTVAVESPFLGQAYSNFADALLALREPGASTPAAKGFGIREKLADDPLQLAEARFIYGQALWRDNRDRPRAVALVKQARDEMRAIGADATSLPRVERWLAGSR